MRDGRGERDVALRRRVRAADAVDEVVAADHGVPGDVRGDGGEEGAVVVDGFAAGDEGPADGVAEDGVLVANRQRTVGCRTGCGSACCRASCWDLVRIRIV